MPIVPDTKDWTWVLDRPCPECGFEVASVDRSEIAERLRQNAAEWPALLAHPAVRERPSDDRWSALEYGCHIRDVFRLYDRRLGWMLTQDDPTFPNWDQDATAIEERYAEQDPTGVASDIELAGETLAASFAAVSGDQWARTGSRSDGAHFTVDSFARYLLHDPVHHVHDVKTGYADIEARG